MKANALCFLCILLPGLSVNMTITTDTASDGMIYSAWEDVFFQNKTVKIMYTVDVSIVDKVLRRINETLIDCGRNMAHEIKIYNRIESGNSTIEKSNTRREFQLIDSLQIEYENLNLRSERLDKCEAVANITRSAKALIYKLSDIKKRDENAILEVVSISKLIYDVKVKTISARKKKLILPLDFNYWFIYNLFSNSKYTFERIGDFVQFGFEIPLYKKGKLARINSRPIMNNNALYKYRLNTMYRSPNNEFYTESTRKNHCFRSENLQKLFCKKPDTSNYCNLNNHSGMALQDNKCYEKMPKNNYCIHIGNDLYFTTIEPMAINITCANNSGKVLLINGTMNIQNVNDCSLSSKNFNLKSINSTEYIMYTIPIENRKTPIFGIIFVICLGMGVIMWTMTLVYTIFLATLCCHSPEQTSNTYTPSSVIKNR